MRKCLLHLDVTRSARFLYRSLGTDVGLLRVTLCSDTGEGTVPRGRWELPGLLYPQPHPENKELGSRSFK